MERKWQKKYNRETKWKTTLRRVRIPLIMVSGAFLVALVGFPLLLNGMESEALSAGSLPVSAPLATPLPLPTEAQPMAAGQILPEETPHACADAGYFRIRIAAIRRRKPYGRSNPGSSF